MMKPFRKTKIYLPEILLILLTISLLFLMVFINEIVTYIGFRELQINFMSSNRKNSKRDLLNMVAKYRLQKELYENKIDDSELNLKELKISSIVGLKEKSFGETTEKYKIFLSPALFFINSVRFTIGRNQLYLNSGSSQNRYLDIAYYYERNKLFKKALNIYEMTRDSISKKNEINPIIQLHEGFCTSIIGEYEKAKQKYGDVITEDQNEEATKTAKILLSYINEIQKEIKKIKNSEGSLIEKGEQLFKLMAYNEAIESMNKAVPASQGEMEKIQYYKARSLEETGDTEKSVEIYQDIITQNPESEFAELSNRRIVSISALDSKNKDLKELADKNNETIKDAEYFEYTKAIEAAVGEDGDLSIEDMLADNTDDSEMVKSILKENREMEKEKEDFIDKIVTTVVEEGKPYTLKNTAFYEETIQELEVSKEELEEEKASLEKENKNMERRIEDTANYEETILKLEALKKKLEKEKASLEKENKNMERQIKDLTPIEEPEKHEPGDEPEIVTTVDQFGKIITKHTYQFNESGDKYLDTYSIYYYTESGKLYKVMDYDGNNKLLAYYLIIYDEN